MRLGWPELIIIVGVVILLFGAAKLPELSRSVGRSLRIFKAETKGLIHDDEGKTSDDTPPAPREIDQAVPSTGDGAVAEPVGERAER